MALFEWIDFKSMGDARGQLVALEAFRNIPFEIKRVYYLFDTQSQVARGFHAHKKLTQVLICLSGTCRIILDNGHIREEAWMNSPTQGLIIRDMTWREMHDFSPGCVLLVLADAYYDESDYIRNYSDFLAMGRAS
jgi:dTDP-4-dehydrorhamnose 3,5-epimerase-like enzyme